MSMKKFLVAIASVVCVFSLNAQKDNQPKCDNDTKKTCCIKQKTCCQQKSYHHFTMSLGYGFSLSDKHDATFVNYNASTTHNSTMRHGVDLKLDYDYNFHKNMAWGVVFNMYNAFDSYYAGDKNIGTSSDDRWLFYVGPSYMAHTNMIKGHWSFFAKATLGFLNFRNAQRSLVSAPNQMGILTDQIISTTYKRFTLGYGISLGASYYLNKYFSIDGSIGYLGGSVSKVKSADNTIDLNDNENLSRLNLNVGVKIKL